MNDDFSALEKTLHQLHPAKVSPDLSTSIRAQLHHPRVAWRWAAGIAAMVLIIGSGWLLNGIEQSQQPMNSRVYVDVYTPAPPTYGAYQHAASVSEQALDDLLDTHARKLLPRDMDRDLYRPGI